MAAELAEQGASEDDIAAFIEASLDDDDEADDHRGEAVDVWPENEETVAVFKLCDWQREMVSGMESVLHVWKGISGPEITSVCEALQIPADRRADVLAGVRIMVGAALPLYNARD